MSGRDDATVQWIMNALQPPTLKAKPRPRTHAEYQKWAEDALKKQRNGKRCPSGDHTFGGCETWAECREAHALMQRIAAGEMKVGAPE